MEDLAGGHAPQLRLAAADCHGALAIRTDGDVLDPRWK
jgi:hypothetical protein